MPNMHFTKSIRWSVMTVVLILGASAGTFAAEFKFDGKLEAVANTAQKFTDKIEFDDLESYLELLANITVEKPDAWYIKLQNEFWTYNDASLTHDDPRFAVGLSTRLVDLDLWGEYIDLGPDAVRSDPAHLVVFGSTPGSAYLETEFFGHNPSYLDANPKLRATFKFPGKLNALAQVDRLPVVGALYEQTNYELYADYDMDDYNIGGLLRHVRFREDYIPNSTTAVLFAKTELNNYQLGASIGGRSTESTDKNSFALGLTASADYSDALHLQAQYVQRGENFFETAYTSDWLYQHMRFTNNSTLGGFGKASVIELIATYRGEGDRSGGVPDYVNEDLFEDRTIHNFIDPFSAAKFPSLSAQAVVRIQADESDHAENQLLVRAGFPIVNKLWGAAELSVRRDKDGAGTVVGVDSEEMVSHFIAGLLYELNDKWNARASLQRETAHAPTSGSWTAVNAALEYKVRKLTTTFGYQQVTTTELDAAAQQLYAGLQLEF